MYNKNNRKGKTTQKKAKRDLERATQHAFDHEVEYALY